MKLCLDIGNSQVFGGLFEKENLKLRFRRRLQRGASSDELGIFFRQVLRENDVDPSNVSSVGYCSVVPDVNYSLANACRNYFGLEPFALQAGVKTGLKIRYKNPTEVGADRIADAIGAVARYPGENMILVDFGTATTVECVTSNREYLGGSIIPGLGISMSSLEANTARLPKVEIVRPERVCGRSTVESIQSGLFWGHLGMVREVTRRMKQECFAGSKPVVIGTGGFAGLFADEGLFGAIHSDLALEGIRVAQELNA